jgi:tetratricopeptide (TPR) repeat protein
MSEVESKLKLLESYKEAFWPETYDHDSHVLSTLADSYLALSCFSQARHLYELAIKSDSQNPLPHYRLAEVYERTGRLEVAVQKYADAEILDSKGKLGAGARIYEIAVDQLKGSRIIDVLCKIVEKNPDNFDFKHSLAWAYNVRNKLSRAEQLFRELLSLALAKDGLREDIQMELSGVLRKKGELADSVALVEAALPRLGSNWCREDIESELADDYLELGRFEDALKIYLNWLNHTNHSVALTGDDSASHSARDLRIFEIVKKGLLELLDAVELTQLMQEDDGDLFANRINPSFYGKIYLALARCYEEKGEAKEAKIAHDKAMEYFGESNQ